MNIVKIYHGIENLETMAFQFTLLFSITFLAYMVKGLTGFGNTLVMNSLFSFLKENRFTTPVDLLLSIPTNIYLAWENRRSIDFKVVIPLSFAVVLGNIPGIFLLSMGPDHLLKVILGIVLVLLSIEILIRKAVDGSRTNRPVLLWLVGTLSGILMGLFGIGALLAVYIHRFAKNRNDLRGNLCWVFVVDNIFRFSGYWWREIINLQIIGFTLALAPAAIAGMWLSTKIDPHLSEDHLRKFILSLLIISGVFLIVKNTHI
jgi:uncharacterized membrane protein YfcA